MIYFKHRRALALSAAIVLSMTNLAVAQSKSVGSSGTQAAKVEYSETSYQRTLQKLKREGFKVISIKKSFLGRIRILALKNNNLREIIISRSTGEIKRDAIISSNGSIEIEENITGSGSSSLGSSVGSATSGGVSGAVGNVGNTVGEVEGAVGGLGGTVGSVGGAVESAIGGLGN